MLHLNCCPVSKESDQASALPLFNFQPQWSVSCLSPGSQIVKGKLAGKRHTTGFSAVAPELEEKQPCWPPQRRQEGGSPVPWHPRAA